MTDDAILAKLEHLEAQLDVTTSQLRDLLTLQRVRPWAAEMDCAARHERGNAATNRLDRRTERIGEEVRVVAGTVAILTGRTGNNGQLGAMRDATAKIEADVASIRRLGMKVLVATAAGGIVSGSIVQALMRAFP